MNFPEASDCAKALVEFLAERHLAGPTGLPLFSYRCSEKEFQRFLPLVWRARRRWPTRPLDSGAAQLYCLVASEWWRRRYGGGPWKWEDLLDETGGEWPNSSIYETVEAGLRLWRRELLRGGQGRLFLMTLATEGGLPLSLVREQGSKAHTFFKKALEDYAVLQQSTLSPAEIVRRSGSALPAVFRRDEIFELAGQLVAAIASLESEIPSGANPIDYLDDEKPSWRDQLPLDIEDVTAAALLRGLFTEASTIRQRAETSVRVQRRLKHLGGGDFTIQATVHLPRRLSGAALAGLLQCAEEDLPARGDLHLVPAEGPSIPLAMLNEIPGGGQGRAFHCDPSPIRPLTGAHGVAALQLELESRDSRLGPHEIRKGGQALSPELPWVFAPDKDGHFVLVAQGSVRTRFPEVKVALTAPLPATIVAEASLPDYGRGLATLSETYGIATAEGTCWIRLGESRESSWLFQLRGPDVRPGPAQDPIYLGMPELLAFSTAESESPPKTISPEDLEWKPRSQRAGWSRGPHGCVGAVSIRWVDRGELQYSASALVAPANFRSKVAPGPTASSGRIYLYGVQDADVSIPPTPGLQAALRRSADETVVDLQAEAEPPVSATLELLWAERSLPLTFWFPAFGARFLPLIGAALAPGAEIAVDQMEEITAIAFAGSTSREFEVNASLAAHDAPSDQPLEATVRLKSGPNIARREASLRTMVRPTLALLSFSADLDATVRFRVEGCDGVPFQPRPLQVTRYSQRLELDKEAGLVSVEGGTGAPEVDRIEAIPLWRAGDSVPLRRFGAAWYLGETDLECGPWLLTAWRGDRCAARPTLWTVRAAVGREWDSATAGPLQLAVLIPDRDGRRAALAAALESATANPTPEDLELLRHWTSLTRSLPPATFEGLRVLAENPRAAAAAAVLLSADELEQLWLALEEFPFFWATVPVDHWLAAFRQRGLMLVEALGSNFALEEIGRCCARSFESPDRQFMRPIADLIWATLGGGRDLGGFAGLADLNSTRRELERMAELHQGVRSRHEGARWPSAQVVYTETRQVAGAGEVIALGLRLTESWPPHLRDAMAAPWLLAAAAATGQRLSKKALFQLKMIRAFAPNWLQQATALALRLLLAPRAHALPKIAELARATA